MSEEMFLDGYTDIVNIDVSPVCIDYMAKKHAKYKGLTYVVEDVCSMKFPDQHFDAAIDKGTMDTLLCEDGSWDAVRQMILQLDRVLKKESSLLEITYGEPSARYHWLSIPSTWDTTIFTVAKPNAPRVPAAEAERGGAGWPAKIRQYSFREAKALEMARDLKDVHFVYGSRKR